MATTKRDYYEVLGVERNASDDDIKKAFRRLAMQYHPDRNHEDDADGKFKELNEAYEVLSDPNKRAAYDRFGMSGGQNFGQGFEGFDFGGLGSIFETFFGGATQTATKGPRRGADLAYELKITLAEAASGVEKKLDIHRLENCSLCGGTGAKPGTTVSRCDNCNGTGQVYQVQRSVFGRFTSVTSCPRCRGEGRIISEACPRCRGTGHESFSRSIAARIPAGVDSGNRVRLSGEGSIGERGGPPGDIYITVEVLPHKLFIRDGDDVIFDLRLNFAQVALGVEITVSTLYGDCAVKVPAGSQTGRVFIIRGKGMPRLNRPGHGDQLVRLTVVTPEKLSKRQKQLFEELAESLGEAKKPTD